MSIDRTERVPGGPLTSHEKALLERLCAGEWKGSVEAREQLVHARWGGYSVGDCECFLVDVPQDIGLPLVPKFSGGPFALASVECKDGESGLLELWVVNGLLHSVDYMPLDGNDGEMLPALEHLVGEPFKG